MDLVLPVMQRPRARVLARQPSSWCLDVNPVVLEANECLAEVNDSGAKGYNRNAASDSRIASYVNAAVETALGLRKAGRALTVFPQDVYLVSYFRSGGTWTFWLAIR
jgi:hypothetical protein